MNVSTIDFGYALIGESFSGAFNPLDSTTYYFGRVFASAPSTIAASSRRINIPKAGILRKVILTVGVGATLGTGESSTGFIRLNNTTNTNFNTAILMNAGVATFEGSPNIAVVDTDYVEVGITTPVFVTNPTNVGFFATLYID